MIHWQWVKFVKTEKHPDTREEETGDYTRIVMLISLTDTELWHAGHTKY